MTDRVLPERDRYASCPSEGKILEYYSGIFEAVYVLLSPFKKSEHISEEICCPNSYPGRQAVLEACKAVSWREISDLSQLPSLAAVDIGLRTQISGLNRYFENRDYAQRLDALCEAKGIVPPAEGEHPDLLHNEVLEIFQELGYEWVWVGDEFCTERQLHWIDDLKQEKVPTIAGHCNVFSPDKAMLWTVHWDSHFTFLCSSNEKLKQIHVDDRLEGFFCTPSTEVYWSVQKA